MKSRVLSRVAVGILFGALATLLVAWTLAVVAPYAPLGKFEQNFGPDVRYYRDRAQDQLWYFTVTRRSGRLDFVAASIPRSADRTLDAARTVEADHIPAWTFLRRADAPALGALSGGGVAEVAYGWPLPALWERHLMPKGAVPVTEGTLAVPRNLQWIGDGRTLPTRVFPLAAAIDVVVLGALVYAIPFGAWRVRVVVRARRGRCVACGYHLAGRAEAGCPECGRGR